MKPLRLSKLSLTNFKNYQSCQLQFNHQLNFFVGANGAGKTNLLDAIHYLSFCKSYFNRSDRYNILNERTFFRLEAEFEVAGLLEAVIAKIVKGKKKEISRNDLVYTKIADHIGLLPLVMIAPDDVQLIKEGSEERRRLLDSTICQLNPLYLQNLMRYNKLLQQRNAALKKFGEIGQTDHALLDIYDKQIAPLGTFIHQTRQEQLQYLASHLQTFYAAISQQKESIQCQYQSTLNEGDFLTQLSSARRKDCLLQRTTQGIHKDDLLFQINDYPLKKYGSQGQQKSFLLAIKLAIYQVIKNQKQQFPILLLDDIFDKLDGERLEQLVRLIIGENFGQVFISDTQLERMTSIFDKFVSDYKVFMIEDGQVLR